MKLAVDEPVVGHVENRAVFQKELGQVRSLFAVDIHRSLIRLRNIVGWTRGGDSRVTQGPRPKGVTGRPPTGVQSPEGSSEKSGRFKNDQHRRKSVDGTPSREKTRGAK